jgi:tRNA(Arg) A34 adenosine deaminase TadA
MRDKGKVAAIKVAKSSTCPRRVGAALLSGNRIINISSNKLKTHPLQKQLNSRLLPYNNRGFLHAEVSVLNDSPYTKGLDLYVARVLADGSLAIARPCPACWEAIKLAGIKRVFWSEAGYWQGQLTSSPLEFHKRYLKVS